MAAFSINPQFKAASCDNDVVLLDLVNDKYFIIADIDAERFNAAMSGKDPELAMDLASKGILKRSVKPGYVQSAKTTGFFEERWRAPIVEARMSFRDLFNAIKTVSHSNWTLRNCRLVDVSDEFKDERHNYPFQARRSGDYDRLLSIMAALNIVFFLDRTRNKCLAYSYCLARIAKCYGIPASLVIGVRTQPFYSHAWVEYEGCVVNDDVDLRYKLSPILVV